MKIKNRSASVVVYNIPDLNIRRRFAPGEIKDIPKEEISQLMYQSGGHYLLANYLQASKEDVAQLEMATPEREYYYSEEQIKDLMKTGSLDEFLDALDFAPQGTIDLFKHYAITLPLTDTQKIEGLKNKTGFDAAKALDHMKAIEEDSNISEDKNIEIASRKRRVPEEKYKIISENN